MVSCIRKNVWPVYDLNDCKRRRLYYIYISGRECSSVLCHNSQFYCVCICCHTNKQQTFLLSFEHFHVSSTCFGIVDSISLFTRNVLMNSTDYLKFLMRLSLNLVLLHYAQMLAYNDWKRKLLKKIMSHLFKKWNELWLAMKYSEQFAMTDLVQADGASANYSALSKRLALAVIFTLTDLKIYKMAALSSEFWEFFLFSCSQYSELFQLVLVHQFSPRSYL